MNNFNEDQFNQLKNIFNTNQLDKFKTEFKITLAETFPNFVVDGNKFVPPPIVKVKGYYGNPKDLKVKVYSRGGEVSISQSEATCNDSCEFKFDQIYFTKSEEKSIPFLFRLDFVLYYKNVEVGLVSSPAVKVFPHTDCFATPIISHLILTPSKTSSNKNVVGFGSFCRQKHQDLDFKIRYKNEEEITTINKIMVAYETDTKFSFKLHNPSKIIPSFHISAKDTYPMDCKFNLYSSSFKYISPNNISNDFISACYSGDIKIVLSALNDLGADPYSRNNNGTTGLHVATEKCHYELVTFLLEKFPKLIEMYDDFNLYPLHYAVHTCDIKMAMIFVDFVKSNGFTIDPKDCTGMTPLHWSVSINNYLITSLLLENGANVNSLDGNGESPIFKVKSERIYHLLLNSKLINLEIINNLDYNCFRHMESLGLNFGKSNSNSSNKTLKSDVLSMFD